MPIPAGQVSYSPINKPQSYAPVKLFFLFFFLIVLSFLHPYCLCCNLRFFFKVTFKTLNETHTLTTLAFQGTTLAFGCKGVCSWAAGLFPYVMFHNVHSTTPVFLTDRDCC